MICNLERYEHGQGGISKDIFPVSFNVMCPNVLLLLLAYTFSCPLSGKRME